MSKMTLVLAVETSTQFPPIWLAPRWITILIFFQVPAKPDFRVVSPSRWGKAKDADAYSKYLFIFEGWEVLD
jgi:hypothetical protein